MKRQIALARLEDLITTLAFDTDQKTSTILGAICYNPCVDTVADLTDQQIYTSTRALGIVLLNTSPISKWNSFQMTYLMRGVPKEAPVDIGLAIDDSWVTVSARIGTDKADALIALAFKK